MNTCLHKQLKQWLNESKQQVSSHLEGYDLKGKFKITTLQSRKGTTRPTVLYSGQLESTATASDSRQVVTDVIRGIVANKGNYTLHITHTFRLLAISNRVIPKRYQNLVTPSTSSRLSSSRNTRDNAATTIAKAEKENIFNRVSTPENQFDISQLANRLGLSSENSSKKRSNEIQESILSQSKERLRAYTQLSRLLQCRDPNRCPNNKRGTHGASYYFVKDDNTHLYLINKEVID